MIIAVNWDVKNQTKTNLAIGGGGGGLKCILLAPIFALNSVVVKTQKLFIVAKTHMEASYLIQCIITENPYYLISY